MKTVNHSGRELLTDARLAHALLDLNEATNNEERRFRAILKADEVVKTMNQSLAQQRLQDEQRGLVEQERDALLQRLERAAVRRPHSASASF